MCIYAVSTLTESLPYLVHPAPASSVKEEGKVFMNQDAGYNAAFYQYPYTFNTTFGNGMTAPEDGYKNMEYAVVGHPSDEIVAYDGSTPVYMDQVFSLVSNASASFTTFVDSQEVRWVKSFQGAAYTQEMAKTGAGPEGNAGHNFGYATCHWIGPCTGSQKVGSSCSFTHSNVVYYGYCFTSDQNTLECGHLSAMDDAYGQKPVVFDHTALSPQVAGLVPTSDAQVLTQAATPGETQQVYRCPAGSPARSLGSFVSKRPLVAGCMSSSDASYDPLAEVNVAAMCSDPGRCLAGGADCPVAGCMIPGANNFNPAAKESSICKFNVKGCTSATALNFNSDATESDPANPCIEPTYGCTVQDTPFSYMSSTTPGYMNGKYGDGKRGNEGYIDFNTPKTVTNYVVGANTNIDLTTGTPACIVAIEGCMDTTAANYDSAATVNTNTWCVPAVAGCMMPSEAMAVGYSNPSNVRAGVFGDGLNGAFSILTTVGDGSCTAARYGCGAASPPSSTAGAFNYDALSNSHTVCYLPDVRGCLNPDALNFRCATKTASSCVGSEYSDGAVTEHDKAICVWPGQGCNGGVCPSPPAPPPPTAPEGLADKVAAGDVVVKYNVTTVLVAAGSVSDFDDTKKDALAAKYREIMGLAADAPITVIIEAASVRITLIATLSDAAAAETAQTAVATTLGDSAASAQAAFGNSVGITVTSPPTVSTVIEIIVIRESSNMGTVIGIIVGVIVGLLLIGGVVYLVKKKKSKAVFPA